MRFLALALGIGSACAQTISINAPAASQTISGYQFTLTSSCSGCTALYSAEYDVDGEVGGITRMPPYSYAWNPYSVGNGQHTMTVTYRDVLNNAIATSPSVTFSVENPLPQNTTPTTDISVTTGEIAQMTIPSALGTTSNVVSFHGTGTVSLAQSPIVSTGSSGALVMPAKIFTAGHLLAVCGRAQSSGATITVSDSRGDSFSNGNLQTGTGYAAQCSYAPNITGGSTQVTITASGGTQVVLGYIIELAGVSTTSSLDVNVASNAAGATTTPTSPIFTLGYPATNEIILNFVSWAGLGVTATAGPGYALIQDSLGLSGLQTINPPAAGFFSIEGITVTSNGPNSGVSKAFTVFVDGMQAAHASGTTAASTTLLLNTASFQNISHQVVVRVDGGNCPGCINGAWSDMGGWEQSQTFANPAAASQLLASAREDVLCTTTQTNCPASRIYTGTILNTDGSTRSATIASCVSNDTTVVTVSGTCTVTQAGLGFTFVTMTESGGMTRQIFITVMANNVLPHFSNSGTVLTAYNPSTSIFHASQFNSGGSPLTTQNAYYTAPMFAADYKAAGFNVVEWAYYPPPQQGTAESTWDAAASNDVNNANAIANTYGLKIHLIGDSWARGTPELYTTMYGYGQTYVTKPWVYSMTAWTGTGNVVGHSVVDEVTSSWGLRPLQGVGTGGVVIGTNGFTQLTGNGSTCAVTSSVSLNGSDKFLITGSGQPTLDYVPSTNSNLFTASNSGNFSFPCSYSGTITSGTTQIHPYVNYTFNSTNVACAPGGSGSTPCPNFIDYDVFYKMRVQQTAIPGYPATTWPGPAGSTGLAVSEWCGKDSASGVQLADYCETYWSQSNSVGYLPTRYNLQDLENFPSQIAAIRAQRPSMNNALPLIAEAQGIWIAYALQAYSVPVTSCSGGTITFAQDALIRNVLPMVTRLWVSGSSGGACDGNYYVWSSPTATTALVLRTNFNVTANATSGTVTWSDGSTGVIGSDYISVGASSGGGGSITTNTCIKSKRGETFTISGSGTALDGLALGFTFDSPTPCNPFNDYIHQFANVSSTGGTAHIVPDNSYLRGRSWQSNSDVGAPYVFTTITGSTIEGASGIRLYSYATNPNYFDSSGALGNYSYGSTTQAFNAEFNNTDLGGIAGGNQAGMNPHWDFTNTGFQPWLASSSAAQLMQRLPKYLFQPRLPSPDYGKFFESTVRTGSYGNLLAIQSYHDNTQTCTANLSPYLVSGQPIIRISGTWAGIEPIAVLAAGTATDSMTCQPGEFRAYLFPINEPAELQMPVISARLADVNGAAKIVVQYSYSPLVFVSGGSVFPSSFQTFDCGTGNCTLPVDQQIGSLYFRLVYLDGNSRVLATSDVQTLP